MANWKTQVKEANASQGGGPYVGPGKHLLRLDLIKEIESQNGDITVAEFIVEETDSEEHDMRVGNRVSRTWSFTKHKSAAGNYKSFLLALWGDLDDSGEFTALDENDLTDKMINSPSSADNPFNGALLYCAAHTIITQGNKKEFTKCRWELREYPPNDEE